MAIPAAQIGHFLRLWTPQLTPIDALQQWPFAVWLRSSPFAYPTLETLHIMAIAMVFGSIIVVDFSIIRRSALASSGLLLRTLLPWTLAGFSLAALTGSLMFLARASDMISNRAFIIKLVILFCIGTNAAILHSRGKVDSSNALTRAQAAASILMWLAVVACGRWIAYV